MQQQSVIHGEEWLGARCQDPNGDFPGGVVVKNPPPNAGDMGSSPGPGRPQMLQSN